MGRKFSTGVTVLFWGAILYGYAGNFVENLQYTYNNHNSGTNLPYHLYKTPYESAKEKEAALQKLQEKRQNWQKTTGSTKWGFHRMIYQNVKLEEKTEKEESIGISIESEFLTQYCIHLW